MSHKDNVSADTSIFSKKLIQKSYGHFLLYICSLQDLGELIKAYQIIVVSIRLHDGSLRNGEELLGLDVAPHLKLTFTLPCFCQVNIGSQTN